MSREAAREAGGRTRSTRGCCAAPPPTPPAEHLLRAGRWDTHPFNAGRASLLHVTYAPPKPGPGFTLSDTPESLFPPTRALSRSRTAWAALCSAESLSAEHAAAHLTERARHCPLSARTHLCPAGGPSAAPTPRRWEASPRGLAPGPPLLPRPWPARPAGRHVWSIRPPRGVCPGSRAGPRAHAPPGTTCVQVGGLQPGDVGIRKCWLCLQRRFLFLLLQPWMVCLL